MKKILFALTVVAALGTTQATVAQSVGAKELANTQELITLLQNDKRQVMLDTLALTPKQLEKFTPIYDEYEAEMKKLMTSASNLNNRLFVADLGGMTDAESKDIMKQAFKLRYDRLALLEKYANKLQKVLPATKVAQFVQVDNKIRALLDVAVTASIPLVTKAPKTTE
jgi:hypothetical protein